MSLTTVIVQNKVPTPSEFYYFPEQSRRSITRFGVEPLDIGRGEFWGGHGHKAKYLQRVLNKGLIRTKYLLFTDAFDVLFTVPPDEVLQTFLDMGSGAKIMWGAEKYCFSDASLAPALDIKWPSATSYKYLNSGWAIGETDAFQSALSEMEPEVKIVDDFQRPDSSWHHDNDQVHWQQQMLNGSVPIGVDTEAKLVWNMAGVEDKDIEWLEGGKLKCVETGSVPCVLHCNGGAKNIYKDRLLAHLKL